MGGRFFAAAIAVFFVVGVSLGAQAQPDFSGKWVMVDPAPVPTSGNAARGRGAGGGGFQPGFGTEITIKQGATTPAITRGQGSPMSYKLDGSESKNIVTREGQQQEQVAKATWEGSKLSIVTYVSFQGNTGEQRRVLSLEGGTLVIEQTNPGRNAGPPRKVIYKEE